MASIYSLNLCFATLQYYFIHIMHLLDEVTK